MSGDFSNLLAMDFLPLSEVKAKLSEILRESQAEGKRIAITTSGRPTAVLMPYQDYLGLLRQAIPTPSTPSERIIELKDWKREERKRLQVADSINRLFEPAKLSRKGQKSYKQETVRGFRK